MARGTEKVLHSRRKLKKEENEFFTTSISHHPQSQQRMEATGGGLLGLSTPTRDEYYGDGERAHAKVHAHAHSHSHPIQEYKSGIAEEDESTVDMGSIAPSIGEEDRE